MTLSTIPNSKKIVFFIWLPLFYLFLAVLFFKGLHYFYIKNFDPTYGYLTNGINLASGHLDVGIIEHPGTPLQCFAAIVIFVTHLFSGSSLPLYQDALLHPEPYLMACSITLTAMLVLTTFYVGAYLYGHTGNLAISLLFQAIPLFYMNDLAKLFMLQPEALIALGGMLLSSRLYVNTLDPSSPEKEISLKTILVFALLSALLITCKIYCLPLVFLVLGLLKNNRQRRNYLLVLPLFCLMFILPAFKRFRYMAGWMKDTILHKGSYGQGERGIIDPHIYRHNLADIFLGHPFFLVTCLALTMAFVIAFRNFRTGGKQNSLLLPATGCLAFIGGLVLLIAKQYSYSYTVPLTDISGVLNKFYYLLPASVFLPIIMIVTYRIIAPYIKIEWFVRNRKWVPYMLLIAFLPFAASISFAKINSSKNPLAEANKTKEVIKSYGKIPIVIFTDFTGFDPTYRVEPALYMGLYYAGALDKTYNNFVKTAYPDVYFYVTWPHKIVRWNENVTIDTVLQKQNRALIYLTDWDSVSQANVLGGFCKDAGHARLTKLYYNDISKEFVYMISRDSAKVPEIKQP
jgi:hypothetical protein